MNILLVGAGAVGQAYGRHLQLGGAKISFLVREQYAEGCRAGLMLYPLNRPKATRWQPVPLERFGVLTGIEEVAAHTWEQVWLCISSTAETEQRRGRAANGLPRQGQAHVAREARWPLQR